MLISLPVIINMEPSSLLVHLDQGLLRLHRLGGLRLKKLNLGLEVALVTRQLLVQPAGLLKRPPSRGRLRPRLRRLNAKTAVSTTSRS